MSGMPKHLAHRPKVSWFIRIGWGLTFFASLVGLAWMITTAVRKVLAGEGLQTYRTFWLVEFNWVGFLAMLVALAIALVISLFFLWREESQWRDFERKYTETRKAANIKPE
jgi:hypothetical protein